MVIGTSIPLDWDPMIRSAAALDRDWAAMVVVVGCTLRSTIHCLVDRVAEREATIRRHPLEHATIPSDRGGHRLGVARDDLVDVAAGELEGDVEGDLGGWEGLAVTSSRLTCSAGAHGMGSNDVMRME